MAKEGQHYQELLHLVVITSNFLPYRLNQYPFNHSSLLHVLANVFSALGSPLRGFYCEGGLKPPKSCGTGDYCPGATPPGKLNKKRLLS